MSTKIKISEKLNEIVHSYCPNTYCLLKEILLSKHTDPRFLVQLKCIELFKWEESQRNEKDIGWDEAHRLWISKGYAEVFALRYNEDLTAEQIYENIVIHVNRQKTQFSA